MKTSTSLLSTLFAEHQPYGEALNMPLDIVLEIVESKLDEGLSYLEGDGPRLARKQIELTKEFGSVAAYVREVMKEKLPTADILVPHGQ